MMFPLKNKPALLKQILIVFILALPVNGHATIVEMQTNEGNIDIQLYDTAAPKTVANFLSYVIKGDYNNSFIHRSVPGFVIQGGGYSWSNTTGAAIIPTEPPVVNEFKQSNVRGTIAMAKIGGQPNSATDQWFFNLADNSANLDGQNGGFTVFGQVINNGMQVVDKIAGLSVVNGCSKASPNCNFSALPMISTTAGFSSNTLVIVKKVSIISDQALSVGNKFIQLNAATTPFILSSTGIMHGGTLTNTQAKPVTASLVKNGNTVFVVTVPANGNLDIPLRSGLAFTPTDMFEINLPAGTDYSANPLYLTIDAQ